jgi:hypothetical protein
MKGRLLLLCLVFATTCKVFSQNPVSHALNNINKTTISDDDSVTTYSTSSSTSSTMRKRTVNGKVVEEDHQVISSDVHCANVLPDEVFMAELNKVKVQNTSVGKMAVAKRIGNDYCLNARQVSGLCNSLSNDTDKLELAKLCYVHCIDPANYEMVYNVFSKSSFVGQLVEYMKLQDNHPGNTGRSTPR